jgi:hypothetical protein
MSNVRSYTDKQLLDKVSKISGFMGFPNDYWLLGVQSDEDAFNEFDDKFYLFKGTQFIMVTSGTTNAGETGLLNYTRYNSKGVAVIKTNEWYYDLWSYGLHKGKMQALRQVNPVKHYRDSNKNKKVEEYGQFYNSIIYANFHTASYSQRIGFIRKLIGGWSVACQVVNNATDYYKIINYTKEQHRVSYCLIKEF